MTTNRKSPRNQRGIQAAITAALIAAGLAIVLLSQKSPHSKNPSTPVLGLDAKKGSSSTNKMDAIPREQASDSVRLNSEANELLRRGDFAGAIERFRSMLKEDPEQEDAHFNLGIALAKAGKKEEAKAEYLEALRIYPEYSEAHNNLGNLLMGENNLREAIPHFEAAIQATPENASGHNNLGTAFARGGQLVEAIPQFSEAIRLQPDYPDAHCNMGNAYLGQNRTEEAAAEFKSVLRMHPDFKPALKGLERVRAKR